MTPSSEEIDEIVEHMHSIVTIIRRFPQPAAGQWLAAVCGALFAEMQARSGNGTDVDMELVKERALDLVREAVRLNS